MLAQSCASVPPAPACNVIMALLASYLPLSNVSNLSVDASSSKLFSSASSSALLSSSPSSSSNIISASQSAARRVSLLYLSNLPSTRASSLFTSCAAARSFQKSGSFCLFSNSDLRPLSEARSRAAPSSASIELICSSLYFCSSTIIITSPRCHRIYLSETRSKHRRLSIYLVAR